MSARPIRIAVLCSFNLDLLKRSLSAALERAGLNFELYFTGYGLWETEPLDEHSALYEFNPNVVILFADAADLLPPLATQNLLPRRESAGELGIFIWQRLQSIVNSVLANSPQTTVFVH